MRDEIFLDIEKERGSEGEEVCDYVFGQLMMMICCIANVVIVLLLSIHKSAFLQNVMLLGHNFTNQTI